MCGLEGDDERESRDLPWVLQYSVLAVEKGNMEFGVVQFETSPYHVGDSTVGRGWTRTVGPS